MSILHLGVYLCLPFKKRVLTQGEVMAYIEKDNFPTSKCLDNSDLRHIDFSGKDLSWVSFNGCNLEGVNFEKANLYHTGFQGCYLKNASFIEANVADTRFYCAILKNANFTGADGLDTAWFSGADVKGTILQDKINSVGHYIGLTPKVRYNDKEKLSGLGVKPGGGTTRG